MSCFIGELIYVLQAIQDFKKQKFSMTGNIMVQSGAYVSGQCCIEGTRGIVWVLTSSITFELFLIHHIFI